MIVWIVIVFLEITLDRLKHYVGTVTIETVGTLLSVREECCSLHQQNKYRGMPNLVSPKMRTLFHLITSPSTESLSIFCVFLNRYCSFPCQDHRRLFGRANLFE